MVSLPYSSCVCVCVCVLLHWVCIPAYGLSLVPGSRGYSSCSVRASLVVEHRLYIRRFQQL